MKTINARSPYFISITGSTNTTLQLYVWNGSTEPASPTYSFTKAAPSATQTESNYDITPYIREYIENITPSYDPTPATEASTSFANFKAVSFSNGTNRTSAFKTRVIADSGTSVLNKACIAFWVLEIIISGKFISRLSIDLLLSAIFRKHSLPLNSLYLV